MQKSCLDGGDSAAVIGFSRYQFWGLKWHFLWHVGASNLALTKARLQKRDVPVHGDGLKSFLHKCFGEGQYRTPRRGRKETRRCRTMSWPTAPLPHPRHSVRGTPPTPSSITSFEVSSDNKSLRKNGFPEILIFWQKKPRVRKIFCPQFWGRKWLHQFYGRLEKCVLSAGKTHVHKIPPFRGGGSADFIFMGARIFLILRNSERISDPKILGKERLSPGIARQECKSCKNNYFSVFVIGNVWCLGGREMRGSWSWRFWSSKTLRLPMLSPLLMGNAVSEERTHWVLRQTRWVLRKIRWHFVGTQGVGCKELTELSPQNSVRARKLSEFGVWNRIRPVSELNPLKPQ